jgi:hypothetical protein
MTNDKLEVRVNPNSKMIDQREGEAIVSIPASDGNTYVAYFSGALLTDRSAYDRAVWDLRENLPGLLVRDDGQTTLDEIKFSYRRK